MDDPVADTAEHHGGCVVEVEFFVCSQRLAAQGARLPDRKRQ
jgi:hypothetical protein